MREFLKIKREFYNDHNKQIINKYTDVLADIICSSINNSTSIRAWSMAFILNLCPLIFDLKTAWD